jgi:electron transport complex protein RnfC
MAKDGELIMKFGKLFSFRGGLNLAKYQHEPADTTIGITGIPERLIFPLQQHIGEPAEPVVNVGDKVLKGQLIAQATGPISAPVHASSSGTITAISDYPVPHASGLKASCIELRTDGCDQWIADRKTIGNAYKQLSPVELGEHIHQAGIVGMGGAGFPTNIKLNAGQQNAIDTLIINGAECEPWVSCDDMLMRERPAEIIIGAQIMMHALQARRCIIAIEDNKPVACSSLKNTINSLKPQADSNNNPGTLEIIEVPTIYPTGGEKQLIKILTNKEIANKELPQNSGIICHNVATAAAVYRAIFSAEPLISRLITITGDIPHSQNREVLIGTPVGDLIEMGGGQRSAIKQIIMGGPMMGMALQSDETPVIKTTFCLIGQTRKSTLVDITNKNILPCIRCGACADVCPAQLLPQQLYWYARARDFKKIKDYSLSDCIECGCCDYVCPSNIPLVQYYRYAKAEIFSLEKEKQKSDIARKRHEFHLSRLQREKEERAARHKQKINKLAARRPAIDSPAIDSPAMDSPEQKKAPPHTAINTAQNNQNIETP